MKSLRNILLLAAVASLPLAGTTRGEDWPQFRGSGGKATSGTASPATWDDANHLKWKTALPGPGSSAPIVVGDRVFLTCYTGFGGAPDAGGGDPSKLKRHLLCINRNTGKVLWDSAVAAVLPEDPYRGFLAEHGYASNTPAADADAVYCFFGKAGVCAFDMNGKRLWQTSVGKESDRKGWGSASSVVLYKNLVIVNASTESQSIRALDKKTGKEVWKAEAATLEESFSTPTLVDVPGGRTELAVAAPGEVWGLNPDTGKLLWYATTRVAGNVVPALVSGNGVVYVTGGFESRGTVAIRAGGSNDVTRTHTLWSVPESSYIPSPVLANDKLYWVNEDGRATCMDAATGKVVGEQRLTMKGSRGRGKPVYASPILVGDKLVAVSRTSGAFVLAAKPSLDVVGVNKLSADDGDFNATPAAAGGQLFIRSNKYLYCLGN